MTSYRDVIDTLQDDGAVDSQAAESIRARLVEHLGGAQESRLIAAVAGIGAWLAAIFIVGFLLLLGSPLLEDAALIVYSLLFGGLAVGLHRMNALEGVFVEQACLATSTAAQLMVPFAVLDVSLGATVAAQCVVSGTLYAAIATRANRALSTLALLSVVTIASIEAHLLVFLTAFALCLATASLVLGVPRKLPWTLRYALRPAAYVGAAFAMLLSMQPLVDNLSPGRGNTAIVWIMRGVAAALALGIIVFHMRDADDALEPQPTSSVRWVIASTLIIFTIGSLTSVGIFVSLLIAGLGFWKLNRVLIVLGALGLTGHLSIYYYNLDITLLFKSLALVASGLVLLAIRWWVGRQDGEEES